ncbi:MAG TPA: tRNA dihydrouridine(20/20a) synthase DusA [Gammaproteobacteria bacterium]|nr:tRNA dihydrouridine(20/20a) synthase DusA [Gammaproteobacteria bacterium]
MDSRAHLLSVAPMMDRTDRHFRYLARLLAPHARLYTEMITARALLHGDAPRLLEFDAAEHPVALQLGGSEPDELAAAARIGAGAGYDEINLNVGCPSDRVQAGCFGAALMRTPDVVADCVAAMRAAVAVPVTVKTRLGVDDHDSYEFLCELVTRVIAAGCGTLIVHARKAWLKGLSPKQNREIPPLDYPRVHRLKADFPDLRVIINGGLTSVAACTEQLAQVDGVMLGRAAVDDLEMLAELDGRIFDVAPQPVEGAVEGYLRHVDRELQRGTPLRAMTRHLLGFYAGRPGGRRWRREVTHLPQGRAGFARLHGLVAGVAALERRDPRSIAAAHRAAPELSFNHR